MENATAADSSQSNISRIYIWKDNKLLKIYETSKIQNDAETLKTNAESYKKKADASRQWKCQMNQWPKW